MAVVIRLSRFGRLHRPFFRIIACDKRVHREGKANEILGTYDPLLGKQNITVDQERLKAWVAQGAVISASLVNLLKHVGYEVPATNAGAKKAAAKAAPKKTVKGFVPATRRSLRKHAAKVKAAAKAAAAAAAPAPAAEEAKA